MGNWTPGPWVAERTIAPKGWNIDGRDGTYTVAVARDGTGFPENEANAQLIAAAPDLLEALQSIIEDIDSDHGTGYDWGKARDAIAKAAGDQP